MSRRLAGNVIKLEVYFGADRQTIMIRRERDLVVRDIMEEVEKNYGIPIYEQVIFHKGNNLTDHIDVTLEQLGVENNHPIRINHDAEIGQRSPRLMAKLQHQMGHQQGQNQQMQPQQYQQQAHNYQAPHIQQAPLDPQSYLKEISPGRVPDPTPYQVQVYNQQMMQQNAPIQRSEVGSQDILKLNVSLGSERETILIHGVRPLKVSDLKKELQKVFKIPPESQNIVFKGWNIHDYMDEAPLGSFGLENNSPIAVWPRQYNTHPDVRLPRAPDQPATLLADAYQINSPRLHPGPPNPPRWNGAPKTVKIEIEHGSDRHQLMMYEFDTPLTVQDLATEVEKITYVPVNQQRLFHKSHEISRNHGMTLTTCEIENNSVVKLIGDPNPNAKYNNFFTTRPNQVPNSQLPVVNNTEYQSAMSQGPKTTFTPQAKYTQQNPNTNYRMY